MTDVEILAKELHEAGRKAVETGATVNPTGGRFLEWDEITEQAREGRRIQARYLLEKFDIAPKTTKTNGYEEGFKNGVERGFSSGLTRGREEKQALSASYIDEVEVARRMREARQEQERMFYVFPMQIIS